MVLKSSSGTASKRLLQGMGLRYHNCARFSRRGVQCPFSRAGLEIPQEDDGDVLEKLKTPVPLKLANASASALNMVRAWPDQLGTVFSPSIMDLRPQAVPTQVEPVKERTVGEISQSLEVPLSIPTSYVESFQGLVENIRALPRPVAESMHVAESNAIQAVQPWLLNQAPRVLSSLSSGESSSTGFGVESIAETLYAEGLAQVQTQWDEQTDEVNRTEFAEPGDESAGAVDVGAAIVAAGSVAVLSRVLTRYNMASIMQFPARGGGGYLFNFADWIGSQLGTGTGPKSESEPVQFDESQEL